MQPVPTINVNLTTCKCAGAPEDADPLRDASGHIREFNGRPYCAAAPVLIPCPIPRSVTFEVVLGVCTSPGACTRPAPMFMPCTNHLSSCPARPISVTCSIFGKTWEDSEVTECEANIPGDGYPANLMGPCRERWASVKALVLGTRASDYTGWCCSSLRAFAGLFSQRDAVYAALADMARAEQAACNAQQRVDEAFPSDRYAKPGDTDHRAERPSVNRFARYVEHIIEQVGVLGVAP